MKSRWSPVLLIGMVVTLLGLGAAAPVQAGHLMQFPTVSIPTVTGTPSGPYIIVNSGPDPQINVRALPSTTAAKIGVLLAGQKAPAKGRTEDGLWILIDYPGVQNSEGWVYSSLVAVGGGELPIAEPAPTATPLYTRTIDPTLAAQFIVTQAPTRLPTFTPPPPLVIPTMPADNSASLRAGAGIPMGLIIVGLGALGILLGLLSLIRGR